MSDLDRMVGQARTEYREANPISARLDATARDSLPGGNTRSVLDFEPFPFRVASVDGRFLVDVDGHRYLDLLGNYSAGFLGHHPKSVAAAMGEVSASGWSLGGISARESEFASLVVERFPSIDLVRFTNSGTEANLMAIATAKHVTRRDRVVVFDGGYHGGLLYFGEGGQDLLVPHDWLRLPYNDDRRVEEAFESSGDEIACVLVEPMMAASGCIPAKPEFLRRLRETCSSHGALLIFDEVMTSRLSRSGAQGLLGIDPDLTTLGKYLAGGLTIGAFGGRSDIMSVFDPSSGGSLTHGGTFNNNELTMAAGVAALTGELDDDLLATVNDRGDDLRNRLNEIFLASEVPMSVTGLGSLLTIHGLVGPVSSPADLEDGDDRLKELLFFHLLSDGLYLARRGFMALSVDINDEDIEHLLESVTAWCKEIHTVFA